MAVGRKDQRPPGNIVRDIGAQPLAMPHALQALRAHQAFRHAPGNHHAFAVQLPQDLSAPQTRWFSSQLR